MSDRIPQISRLVNRICELQALMAEAENSLNALVPQLDEALKANKLDDYTTELGHAFYKAQKGRVTNIVDARKFRDLVSEDDFFAAVKVGVTEARKALAQRELDKITTVIPPESKPPVLVVERIEA